MRPMLWSAVVLLVFAVMPASGQSFAGGGFGVVGPGSVSRAGDATLQLSGGGEVLYKGAGALAELGVLGPTADMSQAIGVLCLNGIYHVRRVSGSSRGVSPFVTGGYSLFFRDGSMNLWNVGGGFDWWIARKVGLRVEVRDHVWHDSYSSPYYSFSRTTHFWNVRTGVVFR